MQQVHAVRTKRTLFRPTSWVPLYIGTLLLELPALLFRWIALFPFVYLGLWIVALVWVALGGPMTHEWLWGVRWTGYISFLLATIPLMLSVQMLTVSRWQAIGYLLERWKRGAYTPTDQQTRQVHDLVESVARIAAAAAPMTYFEEPSHVFVIPNHLHASAEMVGSTLYVNEALFTSNHMRAVIAHQLAYGNTISPQLKAALGLLEVPFFSSSAHVTRGAALTVGGVRGSSLASDVAMTFGFLSLLFRFGTGGFGRRVLSSFWNARHRASTFAADEFVYLCGLDRELIDYLLYWKQFEVPQPYFMMDTPYIAERIERLQRLRLYGPKELRFIDVSP